MSSMEHELEQAIAQLREDQAKIAQAEKTVAGLSSTVTSKDRMVSATTDGQGRLTGLKLTGTRYKEIAPADLCAKIVETVHRAQQQASQKSMAAFADVIPPEFRSMADGSFDLATMFDQAVKLAEEPLTGPVRGSRGERDDQQ